MGCIKLKNEFLHRLPLYPIFKKMTTKTIKIVVATLIILTLTYFGFIKVKRFFEIDGCLDKGGRWNYSTGKCEFSDLSEDLNKKDWIFEKVDRTKLIFKNGQIIDTKLFQLQYIGQIVGEDIEPYLIFSGVDCNQCDANPSIYIHSPNDGELVVGCGENGYGMPGRTYSYLNDSLLYEGRVFYGQVLENKKGVIWYQKELINTGKWETSVFIAEIVDNKKVNQFLIDTTLFKQTLSLLKKGLCKEIEGSDHTSEP